MPPPPANREINFPSMPPLMITTDEVPRQANQLVPHRRTDVTSLVNIPSMPPPVKMPPPPQSALLSSIPKMPPPPSIVPKMPPPPSSWN